MTALETPLVDAIREELYRRYPKAWVLKVHGSAFQASGTPDLLCCVNGKFVALEVKHPYASKDRQVTPAQRITLQKIAAAGGWSAAVRSVEQAMDIIDRATGRKPRPVVEEEDDDVEP